MTIEIKLPDLGEGIEDGKVIRVLVKEGDAVENGDSLLELETGKATLEIPSPQAGKVTRLHVSAGQTIPIGGIILSLESAMAGKPAATTAAAATSAGAASAPKESGGAIREPIKGNAAQSASTALGGAASRESYTGARPNPPIPLSAAGDHDAPFSKSGRPITADQRIAAPTENANTTQGMLPPAAPSTRKLARELGIDLRNVRGTGPGGRITRDDVVASVRQTSMAAARATATGRFAVQIPDAQEDRDRWGRILRQPLSRTRQAIAAQMARSNSTIPHVTNFDEADVTELERIRKTSAPDYAPSDIKLTLLPFVIKAVAQSLRMHPTLNASLDLEGAQTIYKDYVHLGIAVDTPRGLVVPLIRDADQISIPQIARALADLSQKARDNKLTLDEMRGGTFTISNLGAVGGLYSTPIINHPEVAILLLGRARLVPTYVDEQLHPRLIMPLSLSYDHRLVDGAVAARFLNEVKGYLQVPGRLLLAT